MRVDDAYVIDDPKPFVVDKADFSDGVAGFRIESTQDVTLPILVALGYDAAGEVRWSWWDHWIVIPNGDAAHWKIYLSPIAPIAAASTPQPPGTERIAHWPNPNGGPMCFLLEHWNDNFLPTRELLGPAADPDCDGVSSTNECAPWIPNAEGAAPTIDETSCVTTFTHQSGATVCTLGGPECTEASGAPRNECVSIEPTYCTPIALCQCQGKLDPLPCISAEILTGTNNATMPYVKCGIFVDESGQQCDSTQLEIDLGSVLSGSSRKCTGIRVNDGDANISFGQGWHIGEGKLYFDAFDQPCKTNVTWEAGIAPLVNFSMLDTELDNGFHLAIPIRVDFHVGCDGATSRCEFVETAATAETMFQCVDAMPVMGGACAPDLDNGCTEGPMCNGQCCKSGEVCGPQGCSCNGGSRCTGEDTCQVGQPNPDNCGQVCCGAIDNPCPF